jgi:hypothetical protein
LAAPQAGTPAAPPAKTQSLISCEFRQ